MQTNFRKWTGAAIGVLAPVIVSAHPGHSTNDLSAQLSKPFAGVDHFLAFTVLTVSFLTALAIARKTWTVRQRKLRE